MGHGDKSRHYRAVSCSNAGQDVTPLSVGARNAEQYMSTILSNERIQIYSCTVTLNFDGHKKSLCLRPASNSTLKGGMIRPRLWYYPPRWIGGRWEFCVTGHGFTPAGRDCWSTFVGSGHTQYTCSKMSTFLAVNHEKNKSGVRTLARNKCRRGLDNTSWEIKAGKCICLIIQSLFAWLPQRKSKMDIFVKSGPIRRERELALKQKCWCVYT